MLQAQEGPAADNAGQVPASRSFSLQAPSESTTQPQPGRRPKQQSRPRGEQETGSSLACGCGPSGWRPGGRWRGAWAGGLPRAAPGCLAAQEKEEGERRLTGVAAPAHGGESYLRLLVVAACSTWWLPTSLLERSCRWVLKSRPPACCWTATRSCSSWWWCGEAARSHQSPGARAPAARRRCSGNSRH